MIEMIEKKREIGLEKEEKEKEKKEFCFSFNKR
jgi:hypothetical protein